VFENVAKDILRSLNGPKREFVPKEKDGLYLDAVNRLEGVTSLAGLLGALVSLDALICARITLIMVSYKLDVPIKDQPDRSPDVLTQARFLLAAYQRVLAEPAAVKGIADSLGPVADKFTIEKTTAYGSDKALEFLMSVRDMVLLSLAAGMLAGTSKLLYDQLAAAGPNVKILIFYKQEPSSFLAYPGDAHTYCKAVLSKTESNDLKERFKDVEPDTGGPSDMAAPVWVMLKGTSAGELLGATFKAIGVAAAFEQIFTGSLSFTRDQAAYYTPPRIEILHELIHVLHNALGMNREKSAGMTGAERGLDQPGRILGDRR
jgi:hypothetical protein